MSDAIQSITITQTNTILEAVAAIDRSGHGFALVSNSAGKFENIVTDGDVRRAILAQIPLSESVTTLLAHKQRAGKVTPLTATLGMNNSQLIDLLKKHTLRHVPILDEAGHVVRIAYLEALLTAETAPLPVKAVVMAGGYGGRLRPLTENTPKPMLPVGGKPIIEWILRGLKRAGIHEFTITTHYLADAIIDYLGDGAALDVSIDYIREEKLTGTAGPLLALQSWDKTLLVMNGDILTNIDYRALYQYHRENNAAMTVAMHRHEIKVPYATIDLDHTRITGLREKPSLQFFINAGIYVIEPSLRSLVTPIDTFLDMPDFIQRVMDDGQFVAGFPLTEYWLDIGQHAQYEQAQNDILGLGFHDELGE